MDISEKKPCATKEFMINQYISAFSSKIRAQTSHVKECIKLLEEGCSVPFIARYRRERTGGMEPETIYMIQEEYEAFQALEKRKAEVFRLIKKSCPTALNDQLRADIAAASTLKRVEDLYLPFRPKRCTLAETARESGLDPLFQELWQGRFPSEQHFWGKARTFVKAGDKVVGSVDGVAKGVSNLVSEAISESPDARDAVRDYLQQRASIRGKGTKQEKEKGNMSNFKDYLDFLQRATWIKPHQVLALHRGEKEKALKVGVELPEGGEDGVTRLLYRFIPQGIPRCSVVDTGISEAWKRLLKPTLSRALLKELKETAQVESIKVFSENLRSLLLTPPVHGKRVLGVDPGFRHGCKLACIDESASVIETDIMYPQQDASAAKEKLFKLIKTHQINLIAVGNGVASRETQELIAKTIQDHGMGCEYTVVSEAGASVYSASEVARKEFPQTNCSLLGAVSIGRRILDPLSEMVKIDPKSIGLGMYQHDLTEKDLSRKLDDVVRDCVNSVGVLVNSASEHLLQYVSGLNKSQAKKIREYRETNGPIGTRKDLLKIRGFGQKTFEQAAGFLRIENGTNFLDNTRVHPESYSVAKKVLKHAGLKKKSALGTTEAQSALNGVDVPTLAQELGVGEVTLKDVISFLCDPCPDPRDSFQTPTFRKDMMTIDELTIGTKVQGTVRNIVPFGAFVDIGVGIDGLLHNSQMNNQNQGISLGQVLDVYVIGVEVGRKRISLSNREDWQAVSSARKSYTGSNQKANYSSKSKPTNRNSNVQKRKVSHASKTTTTNAAMNMNMKSNKNKKPKLKR